MAIQFSSGLKSVTSPLLLWTLAALFSGMFAVEATTTKASDGGGGLGVGSLLVKDDTNGVLPGNEIRTDLIDKTVLAMRAAFARSLNECNQDKDDEDGDVNCRRKRASLADSIEIDEEVMSKQALEIVAKLRNGSGGGDDEAATADWSGVADAWLKRAGEIQKNYFESVFQYHERGAHLVKDALFYLDIGETHQAAEELLANQRILTQILADYSMLLELAQGDRSGLAFKLLSQMLDLRPYHETFGCAHSAGSEDPDIDCALVMRSTFKKSFGHLQEILSRFFTDEIPESAVLTPNGQ